MRCSIVNPQFCPKPQAFRIWLTKWFKNLPSRMRNGKDSYRGSEITSTQFTRISISASTTGLPEAWSRSTLELKRTPTWDRLLMLRNSVLIKLMRPTMMHRQLKPTLDNHMKSSLKRRRANLTSLSSASVFPDLKRAPAFHSRTTPASTEQLRLRRKSLTLRKRYRVLSSSRASHQWHQRS